MVLFIFIAFFSCNKEQILTSHSVKLSFSSNTVLFDTVFTTIGTANQILMVYNNYSRPIVISSIKLAGGARSPYEINVDGVSGTSFSDLELMTKDSLYIFIAVKINPTNSNSPLLVSDSLEFITNGNNQNVKLIAFGQDVHLYNGATLPGQITWNYNKPYLIYNSLTVDDLTIKAGVKIYLHYNANLIVNKHLSIQGSLDSLVSFYGDRLDNYYQGAPGQWGEILISAGCKNNYIDYADIENGVVGLEVGKSSSVNSNPDLFIKNTKVINMAYSALISYGAVIKAENCVFANSNSYLVALTRGGNYTFYHCTLANSGVISMTRLLPSLYISDFIQDSSAEYVGNLKNFYMANSIVYGSFSNEFGKAFSNLTNSLNYKFDHCILRYSQDMSDTNHFKGIVPNSNNNPQFISPFNTGSNQSLNFELDSSSSALKQGLIRIADTVPVDILNNSRFANGYPPDLGAYERTQ